MANYAIIKDNKIINVIVADTKQVAEEVTGLDAIETTGNPWIDWELVDGVWIEPIIEAPVVEE